MWRPEANTADRVAEAASIAADDHVLGDTFRETSRVDVAEALAPMAPLAVAASARDHRGAVAASVDQAPSVVALVACIAGRPPATVKGPARLRGGGACPRRVADAGRNGRDRARFRSTGGAVGTALPTRLAAPNVSRPGRQLGSRNRRREREGGCESTDGA